MNLSLNIRLFRKIRMIHNLSREAIPYNICTNVYRSFDSTFCKQVHMLVVVVTCVLSHNKKCMHLISVKVIFN